MAVPINHLTEETKMHSIANMRRSITALAAALGFALAAGPIASSALAAPAGASHSTYSALVLAIAAGPIASSPLAAPAGPSHSTYSALHAKGGACDTYQSIVGGLQGAVAAGVTAAVGAEQNVRQAAASEGCTVY